MITGINYLRIFSVMITNWETNFADLQANEVGNIRKNDSGNTLLSNHAIIFTEIIGHFLRGRLLKGRCNIRVYVLVCVPVCPSALPLTTPILWD